MRAGKRMQELKDICRGQRCFIIGNGPSLKMHDLTKLYSERIFATNMFPIHPEIKNINLDYYCASDPRNWRVDNRFPRILQEGFANLPKECIFFLETSALKVVKKTPELQRRKIVYMNLDFKYCIFNGAFSKDISKYVAWGRTPILDICLQVAFYMGFKEIYLLGCDCDFNIDNASDFSKAYFYNKKLDSRYFQKEKGTQEHIAHMMASYKVVKKIFEENDRKIYNAGYGGKLEVFERVNYDELF